MRALLVVFGGVELLVVDQIQLVRQSLQFLEVLHVFGQLRIVPALRATIAIGWSSVNKSTKGREEEERETEKGRRPSTGDDEAKGRENAGRALAQEGEGLKRKTYVLLPLVAVQRDE